MAIIRKVGRPGIQIRNGEFVTPGGWDELDKHRSQLTAGIDAVGLLRVHGHPYLEWVGAAVLVGPGLVMTGGHSVDMFLSTNWGGAHQFVEGMGASVSFYNEGVESAGVEVQVTSAAFVHPCYDVALLRLEPPHATSDRRPAPTIEGALEKMGQPEAGGSTDEVVKSFAPPRLPAPLILAAAPPEPLKGRKVVVVGYPARDTRNDPALIAKVFGDVFGMKALQPGTLIGQSSLNDPRYSQSTLSADQLGAIYVTHDCSTLGGNSGSPVIDIETGHVLGFHYAGLFLQENRAVPAWELARDPHVRRHAVMFSDDPPWISLWGEIAWKSKPSEVEPVQAPAPPLPLPKRDQILSTEKLHEIHDLLIQAGFADRDKLKTLFVTMNLQFVASLPQDGSPADRLLLTLDVLNRTPKFPDSELAFETFLMNAVYNAKPRPESMKLQRYLDEVRAVAK